jgi:TolA-binding protein/DNA-binding beta-propeller fold protein YncE
MRPTKTRDKSTKGFRVIVGQVASSCLRVPVAFLVVATTISPHAQSSEEYARRQYESGMSFLQNRRYAEALKDFQSVIDAYPTSSVADDAMLEIARYQFEVSRDFAAAEQTIDQLVKKYPRADATPQAHVMLGRLLLARSHARADAETALASFERAARLFPESGVAPAAGFFAGEVLRLIGRSDEALERYELVSASYPKDPWASRSMLGAAAGLVAAGRITPAMEKLQRVRQRFAGTPEAERALALNTILYRLYVRAPAQPPYAFADRVLAGAAGRLKDGIAVGVDKTGNVIFVNKSAALVLNPSGATVRSLSGTEPRGLFFDRDGRAVLTLNRARLSAASSGTRLAWLIEGNIMPDGAQPILLEIPSPGGKTRALEDIPGGAATATGDLLVIDRGARAVVKFSPVGKHLGTFATGDADRLAIDASGNVAILDRDNKSITVVDPDGRGARKIVVSGYAPDNPVDLAFDALGHLYVLDRGRSSLYILTTGRAPKLLASFTVPEKHPGSFTRATAFALDEAGRLYIYDERAERVQIYQ